MSNTDMKTSGADIIDWFKGSAMGYSYFDKIKIFSYILNATLVFFVLVISIGDERASKLLLRKPKAVNWIPIKQIQINLDGMLFKIPRGFDYLLLVKSDWELEERSFVSNIKTNGGSIVDVGANIGHYTNLLAKKYPNKKIFSIEASPSIFSILKSNCKLNKVKNVILYNNAISNVNEKTIDFFERGCLSTLNRQFLKDWLISDKYIKKIKVQTLTLDNLIKKENLSQIDLLKIDIESHEMQALAGAKQALTSKKIKNIVVEYHTNSHKENICKMLEGFGFSCTIDERPTLFENKDYSNGHVFAVLNG